jgi:hypothetical protein
MTETDGGKESDDAITKEIIAFNHSQFRIGAKAHEFRRVAMVEAAFCGNFNVWRNFDRPNARTRDQTLGKGERTRVATECRITEEFPLEFGQTTNVRKDHFCNPWTSRKSTSLPKDHILREVHALQCESCECVVAHHERIVGNPVMFIW